METLKIWLDPLPDGKVEVSVGQKTGTTKSGVDRFGDIEEYRIFPLAYEGAR